MVEHARGEVLHLVRVNKPGSMEPRVTAEKTGEGPARGEHTCTVCLDIVEAHGTCRTTDGRVRQLSSG